VSEDTAPLAMGCISATSRMGVKVLAARLRRRSVERLRRLGLRCGAEGDLARGTVSSSSLGDVGSGDKGVGLVTFPLAAAMSRCLSALTLSCLVSGADLTKDSGSVVSPTEVISLK